MNIKTITLHKTDNCGSTLQAMALQKYLAEQGHEVEIIDYNPRYLKYNGSFIKSVVKKIVYYNEHKNQEKKNMLFSNKHLQLTNRSYKSLKSLKKYQPKADIFITGSDQVWNPSYQCGRDLAYYLDFVSDGTPKYSYAASVGKVEVPKMEKDWIAGQTQGFSGISVREKSTQGWLSEMVKSTVDCVCDPVFLLSDKSYRLIKTQPSFSHRYILVYLVQPSPVLDLLIERLKRELDCIVVLIYGVRANCKCDYHIRDVSPDEFLGFIDHAIFVVASSFHAAAFAHIFEKDFAVILPKSNSERIEHLLQTTGLSNRVVSDTTDIDNVLLPIDYTEARKSLYNFVEDSKNILNKYCEVG